MKNTIKNIGLKNDLKEIVGNPTNIGNVSKGDVSGNSIEVTFNDPQAFSSYTYYENESLRDADYQELERLISENNVGE
jgi:hypothetical protein